MTCKSFYSLNIEKSIFKGKPNDFLGVLYVTFDYLCQLVTLVHGFDLQHVNIPLFIIVNIVVHPLGSIPQHCHSTKGHFR